jgi:hypothetical protein
VCVPNVITHAIMIVPYCAQHARTMSYHPSQSERDGHLRDLKTLVSPAPGQIELEVWGGGEGRTTCVCLMCCSCTSIVCVDGRVMCVRAARSSSADSN